LIDEIRVVSLFSTMLLLAAMVACMHACIIYTRTSTSFQGRQGLLARFLRTFFFPLLATPRNAMACPCFS